MIKNPTVMINGSAQKYVPNTFSFKTGQGSRTTMTETLGNGQVSMEIVEDVTTQKGFVKFSVAATVDNVNKYRQYMQNLDANAIELSGDIEGSFARMTILEEQEINIGSDATFDIIFEGTPMI